MYKITCFGSDKALRLIQRPCHHDERGMFTEAYRQDFLKAAGIGDNFVQDNYAVSNPGVIRGLHFQSGVYAQAKLVTVLQGVIFDVAVDMRPASPHYRQVYTFMLRAGEGLSLYVPRGFAHGYAVPHEEALIYYKCSAFYNPLYEQGIYYDDPALQISWPVTDPVLSDKDRRWPLLN